jgi:hypothetical protein
MKLSDEENCILHFIESGHQYTEYVKKKLAKDFLCEVNKAIRQLMEEKDRYREALEVIAEHSKPFCALHLITKDKQIDDLMNTAKQALGTDDA